MLLGLRCTSTLNRMLTARSVVLIAVLWEFAQLPPLEKGGWGMPHGRDMRARGSNSLQSIIFDVRPPWVPEQLEHPFALDERCAEGCDGLEDAGGAQHLLGEGVGRRRRHAGGLVCRYSWNNEQSSEVPL